MIKWTLIVVLALAGLAGAVTLIGASLPKAHRASRTIELASPPPAVFAVVSDFAKYPDWRSDVTRMDVSGAAGIGATLREHGRHGEIPYRVEAFEPPARMVTRIADANLPFGGTWTYELRPNGSGTELTLTEDGEVYNPIFRFVQKFFLSEYATIDGYLADLKKRLGEA